MRHTEYDIRHTKCERRLPRAKSRGATGDEPVLSEFILSGVEVVEGRRIKTGFTLIEMLIVIAVVAILISMVIAVASRIDNRARQQLTEGTLAILNAALEQFSDYGYRYKDAAYDDFDFPLDCNNFTQPPTDRLETTLEYALGLNPDDVLITNGTHDPNYSGSEALYFFLSQVPACRKTIGQINSSLITDKDADGKELILTIDFGSGGKDYPLLRFIDPWGKTLWYDYYDEWEPDPDIRKESRKNFPLITSAGPDGIFGNDDDITNR